MKAQLIISIPITMTSARKSDTACEMKIDHENCSWIEEGMTVEKFIMEALRNKVAAIEPSKELSFGPFSEQRSH